MAHESQLDESGIQNLLGKLAEAAPSEIRIVLFGGGALALQGLKVATKDVDAVLVNDCDSKDVLMMFEKVGLVPVDGYYLPGAPLDPLTMFQSETAWFDLFLPGRIMGGLSWTSDFDARAIPWRTSHHLSVRLADPTTVFLLKSVTGRWHVDSSRDLPDLASLLDRNIVDMEFLRSEWQAQCQMHPNPDPVIEMATDAVRRLQGQGYSIAWNPQDVEGHSY